MLSVFLAHAAADAQFFLDLGVFLESGCDGVNIATDSTIRPGEDLLSACERGLSADILLLVLSAASNLPRWALDRWKPLLLGETDTRIGVVLLEPCLFPELFRRKLRFFDATSERLMVLRQIKRWVKGSGETAFTPDLEPFYRDLADRAGVVTATAESARRFGREAAGDFEAVCRIAGGGTLAEIAGELGTQLGMTLDRPVADNCRRIRDLLEAKRCLVIFEAPEVPVADLMPEGGRTSFVITADSLSAARRPKTLAAARSLVSAGRLAEAYELLHELFDGGVDSESCARELTWICDHWGWYVEAGQLRATFRIAPSEQLSLF